MISSESKTENKMHLSSSSSSFDIIFAVNINSNMNAGNVTKLHTFEKHRTNRKDLVHFDCITAC